MVKRPIEVGALVEVFVENTSFPRSFVSKRIILWCDDLKVTGVNGERVTIRRRDESGLLETEFNIPLHLVFDARDAELINDFHDWLNEGPWSAPAKFAFRNFEVKR